MTQSRSHARANAYRVCGHTDKWNMYFWRRRKKQAIYFVFSLSFPYISERRYGFYRLGVFIAIIIVLLLILGTIPVTLILKNNQIVLICLCSTLLAVAILLSVFCVWQHEQVKRQRARSSLPYIIHRQHKVQHMRRLSSAVEPLHLVLISVLSSISEWHLYGRADHFGRPLVVALLAAVEQERLHRPSVAVAIHPAQSHQNIHTARGVRGTAVHNSRLTHSAFTALG